MANLEELMAVIGVLGDSWQSLDPRLSPTRLIGWLSVLSGEPQAVMAAKGDEILAAVTDDPPPDMATPAVVVAA